MCRVVCVCVDRTGGGGRGACGVCTVLYVAERRRKDRGSEMATKEASVVRKEGGEEGRKGGSWRGRRKVDG
jgi:hypothetical protein